MQTKDETVTKRNGTKETKRSSVAKMSRVYSHRPPPIGKRSARGGKDGAVAPGRAAWPGAGCAGLVRHAIFEKNQRNPAIS